ncbi:AraC-like DNA-binding protein [Chitinophaga niastensis]|uniref:AraC-like DNA-binding protein n=1 Tax=Chitinophaga niastensis TaxID=536980 RepID=A0A2P8HHL6_CHINA|nr:AraC family transcriptional regulator [Chitinophaga niastensis]PSL45714.1 AraC-like DNA-binding protein [Chitinophaga niastensis]
MPSKWFYPASPLREYISTYILSDYTDGFVGTTTYMYPTGSAVLCFSLDRPAIFKEISSGQMIKHARFNFIHQFKQPRIYEVIAFPAKVLHVIFKPYGAYRLLGIPQNCSFDEHGTSLPGILADKIIPLLNQIEDAGDNSHHVIRLVNQWLEDQLIKKEKLDVARVRHACMLIEANQGNLSIEQLAKKVWLSKRALQYQFQEQVGLSPKLYSRITRFNALLAGIKNNQLTDWQEIVSKYNYFDQSHFIKEFKYFSGNSPAHLPDIRAILS